MPDPSIVARGAVGLRKEASFASGGGIDSWQPVESSTGHDKSNDHIFNDRIRNSPEQIGGRYAQTSLTAGFVFGVSPQGPTQWWECGIGGSGPYTPQIPLSSMLVEIQEGDVGASMSSGDMISRVELSSRKGDILRCSISIEGKDASARAATSIPAGAFPSGDDPFLHSEAVFTLNGVTNNQVEAFSVTKENNLITDLFANQTTRRAIPATKAIVTGSISLLFEDTTQRNRFFNHTTSSLTALYTRGARSFRIDLNRIVFTNASRPLDGQSSWILETLNFTAFVDDPTAENSLKVTVAQ